MSFPWRLPTSLTQRFALAVAGLAAATLLLTSFASWWLLSQQNGRALQELAARERQFHAMTVGLNLTALSARMAEVAGSTILATGLVDSAGKEIYLQPFLAGIRQINGIPVQVLFTDFEGGEIASNNGTFSAEQRQWLREQLLAGHPAPVARLFAQGDEQELVAMEPLIYPRTQTPEGALLYKVSLKDLFSHASLRLVWGQIDAGDAALVPAPAVFETLAFKVQGTVPSASAGRMLAPQYATILLLTLALFLTVVLAGARIASLLTRDLRRLDQFSRQLGRDGLSPGRVEVTGSQEVATVAASINQMLDRLSEQHEALLREGRKLNELADALRLADRRKDEFLAMLAHELRNPLAPIMTGAEMLQRVSAHDERIARTGDIIVQQAAHMTRIIDDLLDVSRVTRGLVTLKKEALDFNAAVAVAVEQIRPMIDARGHQLSVSLPDEPVPVRGDRARLIQVVSNLLNNAAKYTPDGGRIELRAVLAGDEVVLTVSDNGSGISPELMPEIFDLFTQGERTSDRRHGGLGLGLALVRSLIEQHGGSVTAASPGLGQGSTFTMRLPCDHSLQLPAAALPPPPQAATGALTIHVVDDNQDAARTLALLLEMDGHQVSVTFDATSALAYAAEHQPDVFILDIGLPDMDGTMLAQCLRAMPAHAHTALIALTGYGQAADRARSMAAGFDHHLVKPVNYGELSVLLAQVAQGRGLAAIS